MIRLALWLNPGQPQQQQWLAAAARIINEHSDAWGIEVRLKYLGQGSPLAPYIAADLRRRQQRRDGAEWQPPLSAEQAKMVADHTPLISKYANDIARGNQALFTELEVLGLQELEKMARKYDPSRKVSFGSFATKRLRGAMLDHAVMNRSRTVARGNADDVIALLPKPSRRETKKRYDEMVPGEGAYWYLTDADVDPRDNANGSDSGALVQQYLENGGGVKHRFGKLCVPVGTMAALEQLLPRLNRRQRAVYRGRVLDDPPLSRAELARRLGIADVTQISRIERQAQRKMAKWLKVGKT